MTVDRPISFQGTPDERLANYNSHSWTYYDHEEPAECNSCCAKAYHVAADYPCGVEPPREIITL